jgi:NAD(P)-dependent dehydrogenase (short-subunit alcohol dehydrogenase family)
MSTFSGKIALVTGGNSGIGRATAIRFATEGADVAIVARNAAAGQAVVQEIEALGRHASFHQADVAEAEQLQAAMNEILSRYGRIDVAFNNAGMSGSAAKFDAVSVEEFERVMRTNVMGVYHCMQLEIGHFLERGTSGAIVNCASISGLVGVPNQSAYSASKHAVVGLTKSVALEYAAAGIRINAICPGGVITPMLKNYLRALPPGTEAASPPPIGRPARAEEIAGLVTWLCSDDASYVVGQAYAIDGGYTVK